MRITHLWGVLPGLAFSCLCSVTFAYQSDSGFDGFYMGASIGGTTTSVNQDMTVTVGINSLGGVLNSDNIGFQTGPLSLKTNNSFKGALYTGFGKCWDAWYLAAEIFVDLAQYRNLDAIEGDSFETALGGATILVTEEQADTHTKLSPFQFGVDLRPGVLLTPTSMLYGRIGFAYVDLNLNTNAVFAGNLPVAPDVWALILPLSVKRDVAALRLGGGLEQHICPRLNVRLDYTYTYYGRESISGAVDETFAASGNIFTLNTDTSVKVYNNTLMLGLTYLIK